MLKAALRPMAMSAVPSLDSMVFRMSSTNFTTAVVSRLIVQYKVIAITVDDALFEYTPFHDL